MKWIETSAGVIFKEKTGTTIKYVPIDGVIPVSYTHLDVYKRQV